MTDQLEQAKAAWRRAARMREYAPPASAAELGQADAAADAAIDVLGAYSSEQRAFDSGCLLGIATLPGLPGDRRDALISIAKRLFDPEAHCRKCGGAMAPGQALESVLGGVGDFGRHDVVTLSPTGQARMVDCMKCMACGWSVTK